MTKVKTPEPAGEVTSCYCRKCMKTMPVSNFFQAVDAGLIDSNGYLSVCKACITRLYDEEFTLSGSIEKAIHKLCIYLNIRFSQDAVESTKAHITTQIENGNTPSPVFSTYKTKLIAGIKSMDKSIKERMIFEDTGTIFLSPIVKEGETISEELKNFWGDNFDYKDIQYLEREYANAKMTHRADTFAEITLLKEVIYKMLEIKHAREVQRDTSKMVQALQELMKNLAISPNAVNASANGGKALDTFGLWIQDIEKEEPAQWLKGDGKKYEMYRDVSNVEEYFQKFLVRPLKNFITASRDFNIGLDEETDDDAFTEISSSEEED